MSRFSAWELEETVSDDERARMPLPPVDRVLLATLDRRLKRARDVTQLVGVIALGSFPIVAAYHIDLEPGWRLTIDLGSGLWTLLPLGALLSWIHALRLGRMRRRLES